jgi:hypothetical protein
MDLSPILQTQLVVTGVPTEWILRSLYQKYLVHNELSVYLSTLVAFLDAFFR